jgi:hypothetical protein
VLDLAVAMLETDTMQASSYPYGDSKTGDSANFGIFKQNWYMLRTSCSYLEGQTASQWNDGEALNGSLSEDVSCISQSQSHYGLTLWFAGQRDGQSGLSNPNQTIITEYVAGSIGSNPSLIQARRTSAITLGSGLRSRQSENRWLSPGAWGGSGPGKAVLASTDQNNGRDGTLPPVVALHVDRQPSL